MQQQIAPQNVYLSESLAQECVLSIRLCADGFLCFIAHQGPSLIEAHGEFALIHSSKPLSIVAEETEKENSQTAVWQENQHFVEESSLPLCSFLSIAGPVAEQWQNLFFLYPWLTLPYRQVRVLFRPLNFILTPSAIEGIDLKAWWKVVAMPHSEEEEGHTHHFPLGVGQPLLTTVWAQSYHSFFLRTYPGVSFYATSWLLLQELLSESRKRIGFVLAVEVFSGGMELGLAEKGAIRFASAYQWPPSGTEKEQLHQILYFITKWIDAAHMAPEDCYCMIYDGEQESLPLVSSLVQGVQQELSRIGCHALQKSIDISTVSLG